MTQLLAWLLALAAIVFLLRAIARDNRLWGKRVDGSSRWRIWIRPRRLGEGMQMNFVERERRASLRDLAVALVLGLVAFVVSMM